MTAPNTNEWDIEHIVAFNTERGMHRVQFLRIDPNILRAAQGNSLNDQRSIFMLVGKAFGVRPSRIRWDQLSFGDPNDLQ